MMKVQYYRTETLYYLPATRAWWGDMGGGGFESGSYQLNASPHAAFFGDFLGGARKLPQRSGRNFRLVKALQINKEIAGDSSRIAPAILHSTLYQSVRFFRRLAPIDAKTGDSSIPQMPQNR